MKLKYIPNILSAIRIALVFAFAYVFFAFYPDGLAAAAGIFILMRKRRREKCIQGRMKPKNGSSGTG